MRIFSVIRNFFRQERSERDLDSEVRAHLDLLTEEKLREGLPPDQARRAARIDLGGVEQVKEEVRAARSSVWLEQLWQDVRFGARQLRRNPGFTTVAVLTFGLGIGANTAMFSTVNGVLLRPLPVPSPEQVVVLAVEVNGSPLGAVGFSFPQFREFREQARPFAQVFGQALVGPDVGLAADDRTDPLCLTAVSSDYFSGLGLNPAVGRLILPGEGEKPGEEGVLVLNYSFWQRRFGSDPSIVGKRARIGGVPVTIIGVAPADFHGSTSILDIDGYVTFSTITPDEHWKPLWTDRNLRRILVMARLNPGVSMAQAQARLDLIAGRLAGEYPATDQGVRVRVIPERFARPIPYANNGILVIAGLFLALTALLLVIACTNITSILMARASVRRREMALRTALGAGRARLIRQMLVEVLLVTILGGAAGLLIAAWANRMVRSIHLPSFPLQFDCSLDWRVFSFALVAVVASGIFAGMWPALHATRADVHATLHGGGDGGDSREARGRVRGDLMAAQVAGSLALLIVAGLFVRSLHRAEQTYLGFDPAQVLNVTLDPHANNYDVSQTEEFYRDLEARVGALPGVESVSLASFVPIESPPGKQAVYIEDRPLPPNQRPPTFLINRVDAGYFKTLRIPILRGREFAASDDETAPAVAIVNQTMANRFWPNQDPIGKRFSLTNQDGPFLQVVGVMQDGKYLSIGEDPQPYFAVPLLQNYVPRRILQIRSSLPFRALSDLVRREIQALAPGMPILGLRTMKESVASAKGLFTYRLGAWLAAVLGILGLLLATIGVYGVVSYGTAQRTQEIGIRMALGASSRDIGRLVLGRAARLILAGVFAGLLAAWGLTRATSFLLLGISGTDAITYVSCTILISAVAFLACWIPLRRALRGDPLAALRHE